MIGSRYSLSTSLGAPPNVMVHQMAGRLCDGLCQRNDLCEKFSSDFANLLEFLGFTTTIKQFQVRNRRKIALRESYAINEVSLGRLPSQLPNQNVRVDDQRRYRGARILLSHAWTSFMSSRSAHIPNAGWSAARLTFSSFSAVSFTTGLPRT